MSFLVLGGSWGINVNLILINYPVYAIHNTKKGHLMWIRRLCVKLGERGRYTFVFLFQPYGESSRNRATYLQSRDQTPQGCILNYSNTPVQREFFVLLNTIGNPHPPANFMTIHILPLRLLSRLSLYGKKPLPEFWLWFEVD